MKRVPVPSLITAFVLVLILVIYSITYQVRFSESVVKVRFGAPREVISDAGLKFKWPPPIETVRHYDTRWRVLETPETEIKTRDSQNVIVGCFAIWKIQDPLLFYKRVPEERTAEAKLRARINESRAKVIGQHDWSDFVNLDSQLVNQSYQRIEGEMLADAAPGIQTDYGVELKRVGIWRISLPEETTASVQDAMRKERERMANTYREEGESLKQAIVARAESQSDQIMAFAERKAGEIEAAGVAATRRIFEQIPQQDTQFFIWLRWLDALKSALAQKTTIFIDSKSELFQHFAQPPTEVSVSPGSEPAPPSAAVSSPSAPQARPQP